MSAVFKKDDSKAEAAAASVDTAMDDLLSKLKQLKVTNQGSILPHTTRDFYNPQLQIALLCKNIARSSWGEGA